MVCFEFKTEHIKIYTVLQIACHLDRYYSEIISLGHSIRLVVEQTYHPNGCQDRYQSSDDTRFVELYILHVLQIACHLDRYYHGDQLSRT